MRTLYIECNMGAAGDMLMSALSELLPNAEGFMERLNSLNIPNVKFERKITSKCGITGTHIDVSVNGVREDDYMHEHEHEHEHHHEHKHHHHSHCEHEYSGGNHHSHTAVKDIEHIINNLDIPARVKEHAVSVYRLIAEAESRAHGCDMEHIHFHEVGTMDAVADVVGVCMLIDELKPDKIIVSPVRTGCGQVKCAHGILPVPAPATAYILKDVPIYSGSIKGELCTPTGAALLKHFSDEFSDMPIMRVSKTGYGMGTKDFEAANCLRAMLGEAGNESDAVYELCCNIDDMTGEEIGFAMDILLDGGALDVFTAPIGMKKCRPGILLTCICSRENREKIAGLIFKHTSTIGIREKICGRYVMSRKFEETETKYGTVRVKTAYGFGAEKSKPEYEDIAAIAEENNISITEVKEELKRGKD